MTIEEILSANLAPRTDFPLAAPTQLTRACGLGNGKWGNGIWRDDQEDSLRYLQAAWGGLNTGFGPLLMPTLPWESWQAQALSVITSGKGGERLLESIIVKMMSFKRSDEMWFLRSVERGAPNQEVLARLVKEGRVQ